MQSTLLYIIVGMGGFISGSIVIGFCIKWILKDKIDAESWCEGFFGKSTWEKLRREEDGKFKKQ